MSDKNLTELEWKKFSKGRGYKDAPFVKALAALETAKDAQARLAALDAIDKEGDALRKANKADKELAHYLDDADKAALKERKAAEFDAKKAAASTDDEEDSPALLTTKMVPLLRAVPKGEILHSLVALGSKECAVLVSRKPIGPPRRKLLTDYLGVSAGVKFIAGECIWEANAHTFVVQNEAAGLAKKLKAALHKQTEQRFKVRVRGEDGTVDDDGEEGSPESEGQDDAASSTASPPAVDPEATRFTQRLAALMPEVKAALAGPLGNEVKLKVSEAGLLARQHDLAGAHGLLDQAEALLKQGADAPQEDPAAAFNARLAGLMPRVKTALASPQGADVKLKVSEAGVLARKKEFAPAHALLDELERLLSGESEAGEQQTQETRETTAQQGGGSFVDYAKARLAWLDARKSVGADLAKLRAAIHEAYAGTAELAEAQSAAKTLDGVMRELDESLADKLDEGLNAADPVRRQQVNAQAAEIIERYQRFVGTSTLIREIDDNPFVPVNVQDLLVTTLAELERQLG